MIDIRMKSWVVIGGLTHTASSYEIATDVAFTNILETVTDTVTYKDIYYSSITVPIGTTYYVRARRQLTDVNLAVTQTTWSAPIAVTNNSDNSTLLLTADIVIEAPIVIVDKAEVLGTSSTITVSTTSYRGIGDGHASTHWVVTDELDNIIYVSLSDPTNLTTITINKSDIDVLSYNSIKFTAVHVSGVGVESLPGSTIINVGNFNFIISSNMDRVLPYTNYNLKINKLDTNIPLGIVRVTVNSSTDNSILWSTSVNSEITTVTIPAGILTEDSLLYVDIFTSLNIVSGNSKRKALRTIKALQVEIADNKYKYKKSFTYTYSDTLKQAVSCNSAARYDNTILTILDGSNLVHILQYDVTTGRVTDTNNTITGITLPFINNTDIHIEYRPDNIILLDHVDVNNVPTFYVYHYDLFTRVATLLNSTSRADEILTSGHNNTLNRIDGDNYIYIVHNLNILRRYNITTGVTSDEPVTPMSDITGATLIDIGSGKFMTVGGSDNICYGYNINDSTYTNLATTPIEFVSRDLKSTKLINGDTLIWRFTGTINDTENNLVYFDKVNSQLSRLPYVFGHQVDLTSVIKTTTGDTILTGMDLATEVKYTFS